MRHRLLVLLPSLLLFACDSSADKAAPSKTGAKTETKDAKADTKLADAKIDTKADTKIDDVGPDETGAAEPAKAEAATAFAVPTTAEEAARQLAQRLANPDKTPEPALMSRSKDIELVELCAGCDDPKEDAQTRKLATAADLEKRARELAEASGAGAFNVEEKIECKAECCAFVPDPDVGVGDNVVNLETVCVALGTDGKPTAYTRVEVSG